MCRNSSIASFSTAVPFACPPLSPIATSSSACVPSFFSHCSIFDLLFQAGMVSHPLLVQFSSCDHFCDLRLRPFDQGSTKKRQFARANCESQQQLQGWSRCYVVFGHKKKGRGRVDTSGQFFKKGLPGRVDTPCAKKDDLNWEIVEM